MSVGRVLTLYVVILAVACVEGVPTAEEGVGRAVDRNATAEGTYEAVLRPVNPGTGVRPEGRVRVELSGDRVRFDIDIRGLRPGARQALHLRGYPGGADGGCPSAGSDFDGDGVIGVVEGAPDYGPVLLSIDDDLGRLASAAAGGPATRVRTERTGSLGAIRASVASEYGPAASLLPLDRRQVVLHGAPADASLPAGVSPALLPVACGELERVE